MMSIHVKIGRRKEKKGRERREEEREERKREEIGEIKVRPNDIKEAQ